MKIKTKFYLLFIFLILSSTIVDGQALEHFYFITKVFDYFTTIDYPIISCDINRINKGDSYNKGFGLTYKEANVKICNKYNITISNGDTIKEASKKYIFNKFGNIVEEISYNNDSIFFRIKYFYSGDKITKVLILPDSSYTYITYNNSGNVISIKDTLGTCTCEYDSLNHFRSRTLVYKEYEMNYTTYAYYTIKNNRIDSIFFDDGEDSLIVKFNKKGQMITWEKHDFDGLDRHICGNLYYYNQLGNLYSIHRFCKDKEGNIYVNEITNYDYENGFIICKRSYSYSSNSQTFYHYNNKGLLESKCYDKNKDYCGGSRGPKTYIKYEYIYWNE